MSSPEQRAAAAAALNTPTTYRVTLPRVAWCPSCGEYLPQTGWAVLATLPHPLALCPGCAAHPPHAMDHLIALAMDPDFTRHWQQAAGIRWWLPSLVAPLTIFDLANARDLTGVNAGETRNVPGVYG